MSHYDDFEAAQAYNNKIEKKYTKIKPRDVIDDALEFCADTSPSTAEPECENVFGQELDKEIALYAKKHRGNKVEGARFCYLSSIASASHYAGCAEEQVGKYLDQLLDFDFRGQGSTQHVFNMIVTCCGIAVGSERALWDGVVRVRNFGLISGKYTIDNHKLPMDKNLLLDAAARHLISYLYIDQIDEESSENHMCHIVANILMFAAQLNILKDV